MRKVILHVGMHKTGSTAIQNTLSAYQPSGYVYPKLDGPNLSRAIAMLFGEQGDCRYIFKNLGLTGKKFLQKREELSIRLADFIENNSVNMLISAEEISSPGFGAKSAESLANYLGKYFDEVSVYAYVRPPFSFASSAVQEQVKKTLINLDDNDYWPRYRDRFEKLDKIFGFNNVHFRVFDKNSLVDADIVSDFLTWIGEQLPTRGISAVNKSLSLEAVAYLYYHHKHGYGRRLGTHDQNALHDRLVRRLSEFGSLKFSYSVKDADQWVKLHAADLSWMENRMGQNILDAPLEGEMVVTCEEDLVKVAVEHRDRLKKFLCSEILKSNPSPELDISETLERMRLLN